MRTHRIDGYLFILCHPAEGRLNLRLLYRSLDNRADLLSCALDLLIGDPPSNNALFQTLHQKRGPPLLIQLQRQRLVSNPQRAIMGPAEGISMSLRRFLAVEFPEKER